MTEIHNTTPTDERLKARPFAGTVALFFSVLILFFGIIDRRTPVAFMPASWFVHRSLWYLMATVSFLVGCLLLRDPVTANGDASPETPSNFGERETPFQRLVFYTRRNCPLCVSAKKLLHSYSEYFPPLEEIDIDQSPQLTEQFSNCVPVVEIDGKIRFRGKINEVLLQRLIDGATIKNRHLAPPSQS
jgi:glutaredoxin